MNFDFCVAVATEPACEEYVTLSALNSGVCSDGILQNVILLTFLFEASVPALAG